MNTDTIINILRAFEHEYNANHYKDGGGEFIHQLSSKLSVTVEDDKESILKFFLNEVEFNNNNYRSVALKTIVEINAIELAPKLEELYKKWHLSKDDHWNYTLVEAMLQLKYHSVIYEDFIIYYFQKDPDKGFPLVLYYCDIIPEAGLVILSQTCLSFLQKESASWSLFRSKLTFLISHVLINKTFSFLALIQKISSINKNEGNEFKKCLINELLDYGKRMRCEQMVRKEIEHIQ